MCGIAGYWGPFQESVSTGMSQAILHRGPDGFGFASLRSNTLQFIHRRLAILDLTENGKQPMSSRSGRWTVTFNGEIYNFKKITQELGLQLKSQSDTEVLVETLDRIGFDATIKKIRGMFAIAAFDAHEDALYLVRDRLGEKPLYYQLTNKSLIFGSEISAVKIHPEFDKRLSKDALREVLACGYISAPNSIYAGLKKIVPGEYLRINLTNFTSQSFPYWKLSKQDSNSIFSVQQNQIEELLRSSIESQLVSDVPIGALLSGGIDSTTIVALAQKAVSRPLKTFTVGFEDKSYDESQQAKLIADYLKTDHHQLIITESEALKTVPEIHQYYDEPYADYSSVPTFLISKKVREHVTVCLSGDGGDEVFGGYNRYIAAHSLARIPNAVRRMSGSLLNTSIGFSLAEKKFGAKKASKLKNSLQSEGLRSFLENSTRFWNLKSSRTQELNDLYELIHEDIQTYLPDDILVKVDRASMAHSLEMRAPYLDSDLVEAGFSLPESSKISNGKGKLILRSILAKHVPIEMWDKPKTGFEPPLANWLRFGLKDWSLDHLNSLSGEILEVIEPSKIHEAIKQHYSSNIDRTEDLWSVLSLDTWLKSKLS